MYHFRLSLLNIQFLFGHSYEKFINICKPEEGRSGLPKYSLKTFSLHVVTEPTSLWTSFFFLLIL